MIPKKKKLTAEERGEEIASRFYNLNDKFDEKITSPYISRHMSYLCALELVNENIFIYSGSCRNNDFRLGYWERCKTYLEKIIKDFENK